MARHEKVQQMFDALWRTREPRALEDLCDELEISPATAKRLIAFLRTQRGVEVQYDRDRNGAGEILLATFREQDVAAGKDVSGKVALKQVINQLNKPAHLSAVIAADEARVTAFKTASAEKLAAVLSDELHYAHSTGVVDTKQSLTGALTSGKTKYLGFDYERREFSFPAPNIALMTGRVRVRVTSAGTPMDNLLSFLAVWQLEGDQWRFLSWQSCKLPPPAKP